MKVFNSVSDLQAASLTAGQLTQTKRYFAGQDGGGATYLIKTAVDYAGTPDGYGDHTLANGNVAVLQIDGALNVRQCGATGDGSTDDTSAIQAALDSGASKVDLTAGTYLITSTLTMSANQTLTGVGILKTASVITMIAASTGCIVEGITIEGNGSGSPISTFKAISVIGADKDNYLSNIRVSNCYVYSYAGYGVYGEFVEDLTINNCTFTDFGFMGVGILSGTNVKCDSLTISDGGTGISGRTYGVAFTRREEDSITDYPRSIDCSVTNSHISNCPTWEALDTHGGESCKFINNIIRGCPIGISIAGADDSVGVETFPALKCEVSNNTVYGVSGSSNGIVVTGASTGYLDQCVINGNTLIESGDDGNNLSGAINIGTYTYGVVISNNTLKDSYAHAIKLSSYNKGFAITGNTIIDTQDSSYSATAGISIRSTNNEGVISGNSIFATGASLNTYTSVRGISCDSYTNVIALGNNSNNFTSAIVGIDARNSYFAFSEDGVKMFNGLGTPEGSVTASSGSVFVNRNGGAGTTLYVKESGTGNTGWVAK